jgi:anthranilate synthase component 1
VAAHRRMSTIPPTMRRYFPDPEAFRAAAADADVIPVYRQLLADRLTPVSAFQLLAGDGNAARGPTAGGPSASSTADHAFLLESVVGGEKVGRHSFIATSPAWVYQATAGRASVTHPRAADGQPDAADRVWDTADPLADLQALFAPVAKRFHRTPKLPAFTGGLVGYAGYDAARYYEAEKLGTAPPDDRHLPDVLFGLYGELVVFDHVDKTIKVVANALVGSGQWAVGSDEDPGYKAARTSTSSTAHRPLPTAHSVDAAYADACRRIDAIVDRLSAPPTLPLGEIDTTGPLSLAFESNMTRDAYEAAVEAGKEYIRAGDIFQFVPSQRLRAHSPADPLDVYRALRIINPSPFMFYLRTPGCTLIGSSPEILVRVENGTATTRPLAGTRRRGATPTEDKLLEAELLADPKERAEHIMLVDLHRNDIGRVSAVGSVQTSDVMTVERYSHVMHITTNVTGRMAEGTTAFDALRVSLPVGTVSGAPKIRAMQIIDELEPTRRGPYAGAVGYVDFAGDMDTCIALRTIVWQPGKAGDGRTAGSTASAVGDENRSPTPGTYDVQAGAGVVADSVPATEYEETMSKARAMLKAVEIAHLGF